MSLNNIGQDRFSRRLTRELEIQGDQPAPVLAPEIQPVLVVEGERPENLHLARERRFGSSMVLGAVAGEYWYCYLMNPATSNVLIILEQASMGGSAAPTRFGIGTPVPAVVPVASLAGRTYDSLDQRVPQTPTGQNGQALLYAGTDAAAGGVVNVVADFYLLANTMYDCKIDFVVQPGESVGLWCGVLNTTVYGHLWWRERPLVYGELT